MTFRYDSFRHKVHIIPHCSGITSGRVLNGELYTQRFFTSVYTLSAFAYNLFHEGFSSVVRAKLFRFFLKDAAYEEQLITFLQNRENCSPECMIETLMHLLICVNELLPGIRAQFVKYSKNNILRFQSANQCHNTENLTFIHVFESQSYQNVQPIGCNHRFLVSRVHLLLQTFQSSA